VARVHFRLMLSRVIGSGQMRPPVNLFA
jgi:hypothetical protein